MEIKQNFLKFTGLTLAIFMSIVALSLCDHLVEKRRYNKVDPRTCNLLTVGKKMEPERKGDLVSYCNCTIFGALVFRKQCIEYQVVPDDNSTTTTNRPSTTSRTTWKPPTSSSTTQETTTQKTPTTTQESTSRETTTQGSPSTFKPPSTTPTTMSTTEPTTMSTATPPTIPTTEPSTIPTEPTTISTTTASTSTILPDIQDYKHLSKDEDKDQIFVGGHWYNKDGSTHNKQNKISSFSVTANTFSQCLTHDANGCDTRWNQRYWVNDEYYTEGGPIFLEIAGEWNAESDIQGGQWYNYAAQYGAKMIVLEHRFYGQSFPINNPSVSDLWLMTSQLALADAAYFIEQYNTNNNLPGGNWAAFGCSYGGNLAAWFKLKYPNHVKTSVSSSGPVEAIYDFPGYLQTVSEVIQETNPTCSQSLYDTFGCMEGLVNGSSSDCEGYTTPKDMQNALQYCWNVDWSTPNSYSNQQMFNSITYPPWADNSPEPVVTKSCQLLSDSNGSNKVTTYGNFYSSSGGNGGCSRRKRGVDTFAENNNFLNSDTAWSTGAAGWTWQTCNEFGYYMSSDPVMGTFGRNTFSGDVFESFCIRQFGEKYTRQYVEGQVAKTNAYYGGKNMDSRCVIFVHGTWDPWHSQGVITPKDGNTVILVPKTDHCADLGNPKNPAMAAAQQQIMTQLGTYLNDPNC